MIINISWTPNLHIRVMAAENSPLHHMNKLHLKFIQIKNCSFKQFLVTISAFKKILLYIIQTFDQECSSWFTYHSAEPQWTEAGKLKMHFSKNYISTFSEINGLNQEHIHLLRHTVSALRTLCLQWDPFTSHSSMKLTKGYSMLIQPYEIH